MGRGQGRAEEFGLSARGIVLLEERNGRGVVCWFGSSLAFPHISAFGSGVGSGEFAASRIRTFLKKLKKKVPKTNGLRNFCGCGGRI